MSFSNNWSISGVTGMTSLKDAYQWNGVKRLYNLGAIRLSTVIPTGTYTDTTHGAPTTYPIVDYGIGAQKMPLRLDDADSGGVQILIDNNSARMRYYSIPGYRINNKAISGVGEIYADEYETAYNFTPALMYGRSYGTQYNNAKDWNFIEYPTCISHTCKYVSTPSSPANWEFTAFEDTSALFTSSDSRTTDKAIYVEKDADAGNFIYASQRSYMNTPTITVYPVQFVNHNSQSTAIVYNFSFGWDSVYYRKYVGGAQTNSRLTDLLFKATSISINKTAHCTTDPGQTVYGIGQIINHNVNLTLSGTIYTPYCLTPRTISAEVTVEPALELSYGNVSSVQIRTSGNFYFPASVLTDYQQNTYGYYSMDTSLAPSELESARLTTGSYMHDDVSSLVTCYFKWSGILGETYWDVGERWGSRNNNASSPWFNHTNTGSDEYYEAAFVFSSEPVLSFDRHLFSLIPIKYSYYVYFGSKKATVANTKGSFTFKAFFYNTSTSSWDLKTVTMTKTEGSTYSTYDPGSNYAYYLRFNWETADSYPSQLVVYDRNNSISTWGNGKVSFYGDYAAPITVRKEAVQIQDGLVLTEVLGYVLYCGNHHAEYSEIVNYFSGGPITGTMDQYNMLTHRWMEGMLVSCSIPTPTSYTQESSPTARFGGLALFGDSCRTQWNGMKYQDSCYAFVAVTIDGPVDVDRCYDNMVLSN